MNLEKSRTPRTRAHSLIPGGCHTYSKGDDQFPDNAPALIVAGRGCRVWDVDGNEFIEYGMGLRSVTLGHAYGPVVEAAYRQMLSGSNFTRPAAIELELAQEILDLIEAAEMVKFAKNGSDVTTAAVKLARAYTGRDMVAVCADHPFFSVDDWFIGTTEMDSGIPRAIKDLTVKFRYNDLSSLESLFDRYPRQIAGVVLEPATTEEPTSDFLPKVESLCRMAGAVFILDEMITGFRWNLAGGQKEYGVVPDLSTFGKAMGNGFSISALLGRKELMELGGLLHNRERVFLLSTTHGAETHCLAAAKATIDTYRKNHVVEFLYGQGERLRKGLLQTIAANRLDGYFELVGRDCNLVYVTRDDQKNRSQSYRTLFLQELIKRGILAPSFVVSYSHSDDVIDRTIEMVGESLNVYRKALEDGVEKYLEGRPIKPVYRRFN